MRKKTEKPKAKTKKEINSPKLLRDKEGRFRRFRRKPGRPKIEFTKKQKILAIKYVKGTGLWKKRLAQFIGIDAKTLYRILKSDKDFSIALESADAEFCGKTIKKAKPDFILKTKYGEEFPNKLEVEHGLSKELEEFFAGIRKDLPK